MPRGWRLRDLVAGVSILAALGLAVLPPEHLHASPTDDGRRSDVVHRHLAGHHQAGPGTHVEGDDTAPRWLDSAYVGGDRVSTDGRVDAWVGVVRPTTAPRAARATTARPGSMSLHDPPPGTSFGRRAPPLSTL